ncbi:hypothetical protein EVAR_100854_1 [Eumeta japonica]|uniref:Uncharacterized protein n=1 Tax=Eumeta variegata TaxID=151549 RepID=A0A4C1T1E4_EUMVA|nr:hypothetical protein EVAR_100854_1 [Eumeta japonica]
MDVSQQLPLFRFVHCVRVPVTHFSCPLPLIQNPSIRYPTPSHEADNALVFYRFQVFHGCDNHSDALLARLPLTISPGDTVLYHTLVSISGRLETSVQHVIEELRSLPLDPESIALLHSVHEKPTVGHMRVLILASTRRGIPPKVLAEAYQYYPDLHGLCASYTAEWARSGLPWALNYYAYLFCSCY